MGAGEFEEGEVKMKASPEYATYLELAKRFSGLSR